MMMEGAHANMHARNIQITPFSQRGKYMGFITVLECHVLPPVVCATRKLLGTVHWPLIVSLLKLVLAGNGFQNSQELLRMMEKNQPQTVERTSMESLGEQGCCNHITWCKMAWAGGSCTTSLIEWCLYLALRKSWVHGPKKSSAEICNQRNINKETQRCLYKIQMYFSS